MPQAILRKFRQLSVILIVSLSSSAILAQTTATPATVNVPAAPITLSNQGTSQAQKDGKPVPAAASIPRAAPNAAAATPTVIPQPPDVQAKSYILLDADTGHIIAEKDQDVQRAPASLTKLMTMYVISGMLKENRIKLTDEVPISETAWRTGGSRMFVQVGTRVPVKDLIDGIVVASGNDACVAMSEYIAGSENAFVGLMNQTAQYLGMKNTHYSDATGLPDPNNYTTPYDLSILTRAIIEHYPDDYKWYSQQWMTYNNIKQPNRNSLLRQDPTVDGLKTGFTDDAGYCLVASAKRDDMRLIAIIMGSSSPNQRAKDAQALLNYGYHFYRTSKLYKKDTALTTLPVRFGQNKEVGLGTAQNVYLTVSANDFDKLKPVMTVNQPLKAPIIKGNTYGQIQVTLGDKVVATQPLIALSDVPESGFFSRTFERIKLFFTDFLGT